MPAARPGSIAAPCAMHGGLSRGSHMVSCAVLYAPHHFAAATLGLDSFPTTVPHSPFGIGELGYMHHTFPCQSCTLSLVCSHSACVKAIFLSSLVIVSLPRLPERASWLGVWSSDMMLTPTMGSFLSQRKPMPSDRIAWRLGCITTCTAERKYVPRRGCSAHLPANYGAPTHVRALCRAHCVCPSRQGSCALLAVTGVAQWLVTPSIRSRR